MVVAAIAAEATVLSTERHFVTAVKRLLQAVPYLGALSLRRNSAGAAFFDSRFYRVTNSGLAAKFTPLLHFIVVGAFDGRKPHPLFDPAFYLDRYPDVRKAGVNPLFHFIRYGAAEGRKPHPLFQPDYYLSRYPLAKKSGGPPPGSFLAE